MPARKGDRITRHITSEFINQTVARNKGFHNQGPPGVYTTSLVETHGFIRVRQTNTTACVKGQIVPLAALGKNYDTSLNEKVDSLPIINKATSGYKHSYSAGLLEPLPGVVGETALAVVAGYAWVIVNDLSTRFAGDNCFCITSGGSVDWAPNSNITILDDSKAPMYLVQFGGHGHVPVFFQYQLTADWTIGTPNTATCNRLHVYDGTYQRGVTVADPRPIMGDQVNTDYGYMFYQDGKYIAIQAPC